MFKGIIVFSKDVSERAPGGSTNITIVLSSLCLEFYNVRYCYFFFYSGKSIGINVRLHCFQALFSYLVAVRLLQALTFPSVKWS